MVDVITLPDYQPNCQDALANIIPSVNNIFLLNFLLWRIGEVGRHKCGWEYTRHPSCQEQKQNL